MPYGEGRDMWPHFAWLVANGALACLALALCLWQLAGSRKIKRELRALRRQLEEQGMNTAPVAAFGASLHQVEQNQTAAAAGAGGHADKYRYVAALAEQGVDAQGIAAALQMAPAEVGQLLRLARIKQRASGAAH